MARINETSLEVISNIDKGKSQLFNGAKCLYTLNKASMGCSKRTKWLSNNESINLRNYLIFLLLNIGIILPEVFVFETLKKQTNRKIYRKKTRLLPLAGSNNVKFFKSKGFRMLPCFNTCLVRTIYRRNPVCASIDDGTFNISKSEWIIFILFKSEFWSYFRSRVDCIFTTYQPSKHFWIVRICWGYSKDFLIQVLLFNLHLGGEL